MHVLRRDILEERTKHVSKVGKWVHLGVGSAGIFQGGNR